MDRDEAIRVLSKGEAARVVGVSNDTFQRLLDGGKGPPLTRVSDRRVGIRVVDLHEWLDARRVS
jgi:excisionase family DNA binding protein